MLHFERTTDYKLIKSIVTHPRVYQHVSDDFAMPPEDWEPTQHELIWYLLVKEGEEVLGLFTIIPHNAICWDVHTTLLPTAWGPKGRKAAREALRWMFTNTDCKRLTTEVPDYNSLALRFAEAAGMKKYGYNPESFQKGGKIQGMTLLGISKDSVVCH